jgi:hypothetical protein
MNQIQEACIIIEYDNEKEAECIASAVSPDNVIPGTNLTVETWSTGREVHCTVRCERGLRSLVSTLDDLLSSIKTAEQILYTLRKDVPHPR